MVDVLNSINEDPSIYNKKRCRNSHSALHTLIAARHIISIGMARNQLRISDQSLPWSFNSVKSCNTVGTFVRFDLYAVRTICLAGISENVPHCPKVTVLCVHCGQPRYKTCVVCSAGHLSIRRCTILQAYLEGIDERAKSTTPSPLCSKLADSILTSVCLTTRSASKNLVPGCLRH